MKKKHNTKKRKTSTRKTKQRGKEKHITLPQELHALIITHLSELGGWPSGRYCLRSCALVCKKWLQEARRTFFLDLTVHVYGGAFYDEHKVLRGLLYQDEPICTFWPYIRDMHVCGYYPPKESEESKASDDYIRLLSLCLSRASSLHTIWVDAMPYSDGLKDAISNLPATKTITSIRIEDSRFPSPKELDLFLGLFPQLRVKCQLDMDTIRFDCMEWDDTPSYIFSPPPSLQFSISINAYKDSALGFILNHQWSITNLRLNLGLFTERYFQSITNVLKHVGAPLKSLSLGMSYPCLKGPLPLSLSHNTSLESLHICGLARLDRPWSDGTLHLTWLAPMLNTIESREKFRDFKGNIACDKNNYRDRETLPQWLTSFDWTPVEDAILDLKRFPGEPTLTLGLMGGLNEYWVVPVLKKACIMPRLVKARRLMVGHHRSGGSLVE